MYGSPMRDGNCLSRFGPNGDTPKSAMSFLGRDVAQRIDYESLTTAQDPLCSAIHDHDNPDVDCHLLHVEVPNTSSAPHPSTYITGFVRRVQVSIPSPPHTLRVYELTWSPATRWMKQSLSMLETANRHTSDHLINRTAKTRMTNAAFSDAFAYLSDNGVLINYSVFQAICLALSDSNQKSLPYEFTCLPEHLERSNNFSSYNSVFLLSHSLGTQVLLDSLGMMVHGMGSRPDGAASDEVCGLPGYLQLVKERLERIGAQMPKWQHHVCESDRFLKAVAQFSSSIKSIYAFTNQLPLFAVRNTSPFHYRDYNIALGFREFSDLRTRYETSPPPLEIVSFHDPDDVLSYNLYCWYRQSIVKHFHGARRAIAEEIARRTRAGPVRGSDGPARERRKLRDRLFADCTPEIGLSKTDRAVLAKIYQDLGKESNLRVIDASLRVKSFRFHGLLADPVAVHSNYFTDPSLLRLLVPTH